MNEEELFEKYQSDIRRIEDEREDYERRRRRFEEDKEEALAISRDESARIERMVNRFGDCQDTGLVMSYLEESVECEAKELRKQEEALQEELRSIQAKMSACENWFDEARRNMQEEEL